MSRQDEPVSRATDGLRAAPPALRPVPTATPAVAIKVALGVPAFPQACMQAGTLALFGFACLLPTAGVVGQSADAGTHVVHGVDVTDKVRNYRVGDPRMKEAGDSSAIDSATVAKDKPSPAPSMSRERSIPAFLENTRVFEFPNLHFSMKCPSVWIASELKESGRAGERGSALRPAVCPFSRVPFS